MHLPPTLAIGDEIRIIAPARKISREALNPSVNWAESVGFKVSFGKQLFGEYHQFSGTDKDRAQDVIDAFEDKNVKAIWCARGGYGSIRLMEYLLNLTPNQSPKWLIGYSDVCVIHGWLNRQNLASIHGTMPINVHTNTPESLHHLYQLLTNGHQAMDYSWSGTSNTEGVFNGRLIGGNLSILYALNGTPFQFNAEGAILFIEDLDEYLYHIDRMLQTLKFSGFFKHVNAIVVGGMSDMNDNTIPFGSTAEESIQQMADSLNIPVVFNFPAGHQHHHLPLVFGAKATLHIGNTNKLSHG